MADSSLVYQGYGRGLDIATIKMVNEWVMNGIRPDITIFVQVTAEVAAHRIAQRNATLTAFEKEKTDFIEKLVYGFNELYKNRNDVIIIDGNQSFEHVTHQAITALNTWITQQKLIQ
jgi:dTMP kinase